MQNNCPLKSCSPRLVLLTISLKSDNENFLLFKLSFHSCVPENVNYYDSVHSVFVYLTVHLTLSLSEACIRLISFCNNLIPVLLFVNSWSVQHCC
jgi:hypothetical protein